MPVHDAAPCPINFNLRLTGCSGFFFALFAFALSFLFYLINTLTIERFHYLTFARLQLSVPCGAALRGGIFIMSSGINYVYV